METSDALPIRRFTADEAIRMVELGIVGEDEHFEFLNGLLVDSDPKTGDEIIRRFTGDEAVRLVEAGIIGEDEHVQLLGGVLVAMSPQGPEHANTVTDLAERLRDVYRDRARVREEKPLALGAFSLPEPDLAVVRGARGVHAHRHPAGAEALLVVELAWSSQREDRYKAATYAAGGVEVYWLLDLTARKLEVRTKPGHGAYQVTRILGEDDVVALPESDVRWTVRELLP